MFKFIKNLFKKKPVKKPYHPPYPYAELTNVSRDYKNEQHERAMKAPIDPDKLRSKGL
jgi:hypothetical protein|tara:strand:+ start:1412 stop:1585 length:174 start_codon:yes stop_codon:yes gene_type:complete